MNFILIIMMAIALWVVSLCRILYSSSLPARPAFLSHASDKGSKRRNVLLVIAHPDDESMFFTPTILFLTSGGHNLHILCISYGNADGKGNIRRDEFYLACAVLKVPLQQVKILDHPDLQDGFDKSWDHHLLATIIGEEIELQGIDTVITFDNFGISGHPNHIAIHHGVCTLLREKPQRDIEAWELMSTSILRKYTGPVDIWLSLLCSLSCSGRQMHCLVNRHPMKSYLAMAEHDSQWVWFRKLFVLFSSYTYMNTVRDINFSRHRNTYLESPPPQECYQTDRETYKDCSARSNR